MEARELKFFKRYLKEEGLYSAFIKDAREQQDRRLGTSFSGYIRGMKNSTDILMVTVNWRESEYSGWHNVYDDYKLYFREKYHKR